ncbi:hypothetical protein AS594_07215 [Streptomyces agglomeratus]|uniref:Uncharacterized protein n=1 Tax=Streptomyces agglomeratus TaxID=285458 RepID=A0A1E5P463_9ACTN|nr:hypothetical protein [Streptomyces agglomeratus]OEJ24312.1 hypothetical protein AS594_07215 [Streptomyces agglomeratus]
MSRYEVREQEPSALHRSYGFVDPIFVVWDTERDMRVAFGTFQDRGRAEARMARMAERESRL